MQKRPIKIAFFVLLILISTLACNTVTNRNPPYTYTDVVPYPVTVTPTQTRDTSLTPRWIEFERALASVVLGPSGNIVPDVSRNQGLCEWEFWVKKVEK